jgi:hypothetical protein
MNLMMEETNRTKELNSSLASLEAEEEEHAHVQNPVEDNKELTPTPSLQLEAAIWEGEGVFDADTLALLELNDCWGSRILAAVEELADDVDVPDLVGMLEEEEEEEEVVCSHCC